MHPGDPSCAVIRPRFSDRLIGQLSDILKIPLGNGALQHLFESCYCGCSGHELFFVGGRSLLTYLTEKIKTVLTTRRKFPVSFKNSPLTPSAQSEQSGNLIFEMQHRFPASTLITQIRQAPLQQAVDLRLGVVGL